MKITTYIAATLAALSINAGAANVLCIGINEYTAYAPLAHAESDALTMAGIFAAQDHAVTTLTGAAATRAAILEALAAKPEIVYFAGHGEKDKLVLADGFIYLNELAETNATMLLDACNIGSGLKDAGSSKVLAAAKHKAFEADGHGLFTKHLIYWMTNGGEFSVEKLGSYLAKKIKRDTGGWQKPVLGYI